MTPGRGHWRWLGTLLRLILGAVLLVAGGLKVPDPAVSVRAVRAYQLLPESVVPAIGHGLPLLEIVVGLLLVLGFATRFSAAVGGLLMVAFIIGIGSAAARGLTIDCGCFGGGGQVSANATKYTQEIIRDSLLLIAAAYLVRWPTSRLSLDPNPEPVGSEPPDEFTEHPDPTTRKEHTA